MLFTGRIRAVVGCVVVSWIWIYWGLDALQFFPERFKFSTGSDVKQRGAFLPVLLICH